MIDMQKIQDAVDQDYETICEGCFAHWSNSLSVTYPNFTLEENKEALFYLIRKLLTEGRVKFRHPDDWLGEAGLVWTASIDEKIAYLRAGWPPDIRDFYDVKLTYYFYEYVPSIVWKGANGKWYGS